MNEVSETFTIRLRLGSLVFPITVKRDEEIVYRDAEKLINQRFNYYAGRYPNQGNETYLTMVALDIAVSLKRNENRNDTAPYVESIRTMLNEIGETLGMDKKQP